MAVRLRKIEGVWLRVLLRDDHINCQYATPERMTGCIALVPKSFQSFELRSKNNMR